MVIKLFGLLLVVSLSLLPSFSTAADPTPCERALGITTQGDKNAHAVVNNRSGTKQLTPPAFLIGIEKAKKEKIGCLGECGKSRGLNLKNEHKKTRDVLNDPEAMFISHIVEYRSGAFDEAPQFLYDVCADLASVRQAYEEGGKALRNATTVINQAVKGGITHLIVYVTGWNTTQEETISDANAIKASLEAAARTAGQSDHFKPLMIVLSWPSWWGSLRRLSYFNKGNDADEVGMVWANALINQVLLPVRDQDKQLQNLTIVVIGHSFGARVASWGVLGSRLLPPGEYSLPKKVVDNLIGLQGAFPVDRFKSGRGWEESPYADFQNKARQFIFTSSARDEAVELAHWTKFIGSIRAWNEAQHESDRFARARVVRMAGRLMVEPGLDSFGNGNKITLINASEIVTEHNDVKNKEMGWLIWSVIRPQ